MVGGIPERVLNPGTLDKLFDCVAERQYTRELLFSSVLDLMSQVVCGLRPSLHAAYQASVGEISVSLTSVYNKLNGVGPETAAALVQYSAREVAPLITEIGGPPAPFVPGYRTKILDGNCLAATDHRLKELRQTAAGALPGKSLVILDPGLRVAVAVVPCEDGHAQERALLPQVLPEVEGGDLWIADRNFCTRQFLFGLVERGATFIIRQHQGLPWEPVGPEQPGGQGESGRVYEQLLRIQAADGHALLLRRVRLELEHPTQEGETEICLLTNLPPERADAKRVASVYRKRWTIEHAFQDLATFLRSEINTCGYPKAALFGFCVALVAYNVLAVVKAALSSVHGGEKIEREVSGYYLSDEIATTYRGMLIAIPPEEWRLFSLLTIPQLATLLLQLARQVKLAAFRKHPRGPKKPTPKRQVDKRHPHVSTARLISQRKVKALSP